MKLPQLEASLFRNLIKHTCVDPSSWLSGDAPPTQEPLDEDLADVVSALASGVADLSNQVKGMRDSVVPDVGVQEFSNMLGSEPAHALDAASASAKSVGARKRRRLSSRASGAFVGSENNDSANSLGAQRMPDLCTSDILKKLKTNVDHLVTTTKALRDDLPKCLLETDRELRAADQVLESLSSNVDEAMLRPLISSSAPPSGGRLDNAADSTSIDNEEVSPKRAIRGIADGSALRKRLAEECISSL